ncbi:MAG: TIGR03032 family protein [Desulfobacterales bacterium]|nr:TIGR03032 family protein [Desulfobacterales bacterium]
MDAIWKTWQQVNKLSENKKIVLFGKSGDWAVKTIKQMMVAPSFFVDNSPNQQGTVFKGVDIFSPEKLKQEEKEGVYIIITTGSFASVVPQLEEYGFVPGRHFCCSPVMNSLKIINDIHSHERRIMIASPDHEFYSEMDNEKEIGGGIYLYDIGSRTCKRKVKGNFHQIARGKDCFYVVHHNKGVYVLDDEICVRETFPLPPNAKPHGIAYCPERNLIFVANSGTDSVTIHNGDSYKLEETLHISDKFERYGLEQHHINDLMIQGDSLFVSCFSFSGNWAYETFDGGIMEYDLKDLSLRGRVVENLWMPHSPNLINGRLCFLDSMRGAFHTTDKKVSGQFSGFVRGLAYDGQYYFIGQSENRYFFRLNGVSNNISLDAGFYLFDDETKASKFFSIPNFRQVHDLYVLP